MKKSVLKKSKISTMLLSMVGTSSPALNMLRDDAIIMRGIREVLGRVDGARLAWVFVSTRNRVVALRGMVRGPEAVVVLETLVRGVPGVAGVDNRLVVETAGNCKATAAGDGACEGGMRPPGARNKR